MIEVEPPGSRPVRFATRLRTYEPGETLVTEAEVSAHGDLRTPRRAADGALMLPMVIAMEAMIQAATRLRSASQVPVLENVRFLRPTVFPGDRSVTIRTTATSNDGGVDVTLRSSSTGFRADHARATLRYLETRPLAARTSPAAGGTRIPLAPGESAAGGGGAGRAAVGPADLAARDAYLDAVRSCVPETTLIPVDVERFYPLGAFGGGLTDEAGHVLLYAAERHRCGPIHTFDLDVRSSRGRLLERWEGLRLEAVPHADADRRWAPALLGPYLERQLNGLLPGRLRCVVEAGAADDAARCDQIRAAVRRALGRPVLVWFRDEGVPELAEDDVLIRASFGADLLLLVVVSGSRRAGCDVRTVRLGEPDQWRAALGTELMALATELSRELGEPLSMAATRVLAAEQCSPTADRPAVLSSWFTRPGRDGLAVLARGPARIASFPACLPGRPDPVMVTIWTEGADHGSLLRVPPCRGHRGNRPGRGSLHHQLPALAGPVLGDVPARARAGHAGPARVRP
jgi:enediyne polyketide synthase